MGFSDYFKIVLGLFKDWRVIATAVVIIGIMNFICKIANYRKKTQKSKIIKTAKTVESSSVSKKEQENSPNDKENENNE